MKNLSLLLLLAIISINQIKGQESGDILVGGNFSYLSRSSSSYNMEESEIRLSISPMVGTMISSKVALGVSMGYIYSKFEDNDPYSYYGSNNYLIIAPFVRIHNNITENFKYYIEPNLGKTFITNEESESKTQIYNAGVNFGLLYFVSQKISMELNIAGITYTHMFNKDYDFKSNNVSIDYDLVNPNLGLKYYF